MSGLQRIVRHPDRLNDPHARCLELASEALLAPLDEAEAAWLEEHLAGCEPCRRTVDAFSADAALLRSLRDDLPPVPRDLGARVSLALDAEVRDATRTGRRAGLRRSAGARRPSLAFAGLAAVVVVALLVGPLAAPSTSPAGSLPPAGSLLPEATPILVNAQPVAWASRDANGSYIISSAQVGQVCPATEGSACGTLDGSVRTVASLSVKPSSMTLGRDGSPAVVVGQGAVYAVPVNLVPTHSPAPSASSAPTSVPVQTPAASGGPATPPAGSPPPSEPAASPSATPSAPATEVPTGTPTPSSATTPEPSGAATPAASPSATPVLSPAAATPLPTLPPPTPAPTPAAALKIADNVVLTGTPPAYSPDGRWVAFSARPTDGTHGSDIYVWEVGRQRATALTTDHASVFSGWLNDLILGSTVRTAAVTPAATPAATGAAASATPTATPTAGLPSAAAAAPGPLPGAIPAPDADPATVVARSFLLDPADDTTTALPLDGAWRPVVDPTGRTVVYWTGTFAWSDDARTWVPAMGGLVAAAWRDVLVKGAVPASQALPGDAAGPRVAVWDVRFDPAGRRLGVWVADPAEPGTGRLALVAVNDDGSLGSTILADQSALPGFSLDADRLAWSTPPGRNGEGSLVTVFAWNGDAAGQVQTMPNPGNDPLVVSR